MNISCFHGLWRFSCYFSFNLFFSGSLGGSRFCFFIVWITFCICKPFCTIDVCIVMWVCSGPYCWLLLTFSIRILTFLMKRNACWLYKLGFWLPSQTLIRILTSTFLTRKKYYSYTKFVLLFFNTRLILYIFTKLRRRKSKSNKSHYIKKRVFWSPSSSSNLLVTAWSGTQYVIFYMVFHRSVLIFSFYRMPNIFYVETCRFHKNAASLINIVRGGKAGRLA